MEQSSGEPLGNCFRIWSTFSVFHIGNIDTDPNYPHQCRFAQSIETTQCILNIIIEEMNSRDSWSITSIMYSRNSEKSLTKLIEANASRLLQQGMMIAAWPQPHPTHGIRTAVMINKNDFAKAVNKDLKQHLADQDMTHCFRTLMQ